MIFFDIDNTLIDQQQADRAAAAAFLAAYGAALPQFSLDQFCQRWRSLRDKHGADFLRGKISAAEQRRRRIRGLFSAPLLSDDEADACYAFFQTHYRQAWSLYTDVLPCLNALAGLRLGIISNGSTAQQIEKLRITAIEPFFSLVVISEEAGAAKPSENIFLEACRRAGKSPGECIHIGDRFEVDALASRAAGMRGLWLNRRLKVATPGAPILRSLDELVWRLRERFAA